MARPLVLGNNNILVGMDSNGEVRDFYYPYVGQENHVGGNIHKIGIWVDSQFSWISSGDWQKILAYKKDTLVTDIHMTNEDLGLTLHFNDYVCHTDNFFLRTVHVTNTWDFKREVRLFFHQDFTISESPIGDTVFYHPFTNSIIHYKGRRYFLINGRFYNEKEHGISSYATGLRGEYGLEGTYKDAEDGNLSKHPIEHGSVDSTISFNFEVEPHDEQLIHYWVCVGRDISEVIDLNEKIVQTKSQLNLGLETEKYWQHWVNRTPFEFYGLNEKIVDLFKRSLMIIDIHIDKDGSIIASSDSDILYKKKDTYAYMWPRDGALIAHSLDRAGYSEITQQFFTFCFNLIHFTSQGYLLFHKYRPDGSLGSSWHPWIKEGTMQLPLQEDQVGLLINALFEHFVMQGRPQYIKDVFENFIRRLEDFMLAFIDEDLGLPKESYDLWEEKLGIHTFTACTVHAGLKAAAQFERMIGTKKRAELCEQTAKKIKEGISKHLYDEEKQLFLKGLYYEKGVLQKDYTLDISTFRGLIKYSGLDIKDERIEKMVKRVQQQLISPVIGGYARYEGDNYYRIPCTGVGNPWFITTLWFADYYVQKAKKFDDFKPAIEIMEWVTEYAMKTGILSEQLDPCSGEPLSVAPLTWSHAAFVNTIVNYLEKLDRLKICEICNPVIPKEPKSETVLERTKNIKRD